MANKWEECVRERKEYSQEFRILGANGEEHWVSCRAGVIQSEEGEAGQTAEINGFVGTIQDITQYKTG